MDTTGQATQVNSFLVKPGSIEIPLIPNNPIVLNSNSGSSATQKKSKNDEESKPRKRRKKSLDPSVKELKASNSRRRKPDYLATLVPDVVMDEKLKQFKPSSLQKDIESHRRKAKLEKQAQKAKDRSKERESARLHTMEQLLATKERRLQEFLKRENVKIQAKAKEEEDVQDAINQYYRERSFKNIKPELTKKVKLAIRPKKTILTVEESAKIKALVGKEKANDVAREIGVSRSSVYRHRTYKPRQKDMMIEKRGPPIKFTEVMQFACARLMFLFPNITLDMVVRFVKRVFKIDVSKRTIQRNVVVRCGFRKSDFLHMPFGRNTAETLQRRSDWVARHTENELFNSIFIDEMSFVLDSKRKAWTIKGWYPVETNSPASGENSINLVYACSPVKGPVYMEIRDETMTGDRFVSVLKSLIRQCQMDSSIPRRIILDNAPPHVARVVKEFMSTPANANGFFLDFLPPYSPFLNICEEVFGTIKAKMWLAASGEKEDQRIVPSSFESVKKLLHEETKKVPLIRIVHAHAHLVTFLPQCLRKEPVYASHFLAEPGNARPENYHPGDKILDSCPFLGDEDIEYLFDSYMPDKFDDFTPEKNEELRLKYGQRTIVELLTEFNPSFSPLVHQAES